jgi:mannitol-1-phosphate/altronate dehydrogenase
MTREELIEIAEQVYGKCDWHDSALVHLEQFAELVAEREREACAKRLEAVGCQHCAENIRRKGQE